MNNPIPGRNAQTSLEYLTTYGWVFLIIIVCLGVIIYFGFLSPSKYMPEECNSGDQIECKAFSLGSGSFSMRLQNNMGKDIMIYPSDGTNVNIVACSYLIIPAGEQGNYSCNFTERFRVGENKRIEFTLYYSRNEPNTKTTKYKLPVYLTAKVNPITPVPLPPTCAELGGVICDLTKKICLGNQIPVYGPDYCCNGTLNCIPIPLCMDGLDNDGDWCTDMRDKACLSSSGTTESPKQTKLDCRDSCEPEEMGDPTHGICRTPADCTNACPPVGGGIVRDPKDNAMYPCPVLSQQCCSC